MATTTLEATQRIDVAVSSFHLVAVASKICLRTGEAPDFIDITEHVARIVQEARVSLGMAIVFTTHTTTAVKINEKESGLMKDVAAFLDRLAPRDMYYAHNDFEIRTENMQPDESPNGHAHAQNWILPTSEFVPVVSGALALGTWQRLFFVELDHPRDREVLVQVFGVGGGNGKVGGE